VESIKTRVLELSKKIATEKNEILNLLSSIWAE